LFCKLASKLMSTMYKLNRTAFKASTVEDASEHSPYYKNLTWQERLRITMYLNSIAFHLVGKNEPTMDKTVFNTRARD
jgi:hypothetical protein